MKGTVLVVDDDRQMVRTLSAVLNLHGWEVVGAYSGEEALEVFDRQPFDAVVMDVRMPGISGVEAFREIHARQPGVPVILMTAYAAQELLAQAQQEGALRILSKPVPLPALTELLEDVAGRQQTVLLVDRDKAGLTELARTLEEAGRRVVEAETLPDALALLERREPGAVVLDLNLGEMHPADAVLAIRHVSPAVALILATLHREQLARTLDRLPPGTVYATLVKPFPPNELVELLDRLIPP
ncbi:MAG: response regulator [Vicinamibacterales bacterium]